MSNEQKNELLQATARIVAGYAANNAVDDLQGLIRQVYAALQTLGTEAPTTRQKPAVPINESVGRDYLFCLEDGKKLKMLKRYLKVAYNMTPAQYRAKWGLPADYPMTAPNYAEKRSRLAKQSGLGTARSK